MSQELVILLQTKGVQMKKQLLSTAAMAVIMAFTGCDGGGSSSDSQTPTSITGQFLDSAVSGLTYTCSSGATGLTDVSGHFTCSRGDTVEFSINGYVLGSAPAADIVTPISLFTKNQTAQTNLAQLLQTLDSDGNPDNGIALDPKSQGAMALSADVDVNFTQADFDSAIASHIGSVLVDEKTANTHMNLTLQNIKNGAGKVTKNSFVAIVNKSLSEQCKRDPKATYEGFSNYEEFLNAGGSFNIEYYAATSKQCSQYSVTGNCVEQTIPQGSGGDGSCVMVVTFPDSAITNGNSTTDTTTNNEIEYMTQSDFDIDLANGYIPSSLYHYNASLYLTDSESKQQIWDNVTNHKKIDGTIYYVENFNSYSGHAYVEFYGLEMDASTLKEPRIQYSISASVIGEPSTDGYNGVGQYTMTDEYLDYGGGDKFKFSKAIDFTLLKYYYPGIEFTSGDQGQFVYVWTSSSLSVTLYVNESAKEKLLKDMQSRL